jgi:hypothetical protein
MIDTTINLTAGRKFPALGLGTWKIPNDLTPSVVKDAVCADSTIPPNSAKRDSMLSIQFLIN